MKERTYKGFTIIETDTLYEVNRGYPWGTRHYNVYEVMNPNNLPPYCKHAGERKIRVLSLKDARNVINEIIAEMEK